MSTKLKIGNTSYNYPNNGENPSWGEDASNAFIDLVNQVNVVTANTKSGNLSLSAQTSLTDVPGFYFSNQLTTMIKVEYIISLTSPSSPFVTYEGGTMNLTYGNGSWHLDRQFAGDIGCGFIFDISSTGQVQYKTSSTFATCVFKYKTIGAL